MNKTLIKLTSLSLFVFLLAAVDITAQEAKGAGKVVDAKAEREALVAARKKAYAEKMAASSLKARFAIATSLPDYIYLVTPNIDVQFALSRNATLLAGAKYNSWSFNYGTASEMKNRQLTARIGARWWPWYTYSGWWLGGALQYQEYDRGGLLWRTSEVGDAFGASVSGGYSLQITPWLDLDFGLGIWGGYTRYKQYDCPYCGRKTKEGEKFFLLPDEARIALMFIF